jgi:hypothetical protein
MITITSKRQLKDLAKQLGVRDDWHEPDEQNIEAKVFGKIFDNAGIYGLSLDIPTEQKEIYVVLYQNKKPVAEIDLATLFAFACDTYFGWQ